MDYNLIFTKAYDEASPESLDFALKEIKKAGASQLDSIRVLISELKITLPEADALVLNSVAWQEQKDSTLKFRDHVGNILGELENDH